MIDKLDDMKKQLLSELATVLNAFKSEAVQLRLLDVLLGQEATEEPNKPHRRTGSSKKARQRVPAEKATENSSGKKKKKAPSGTGAPATLTQLLSTTFFDKPRTINDIIEHCKHNLARTFKANEFSGKLSRIVRNGELTRKKNADKQYEYEKP
jgi:hypothetical protein